MSSPAGNGGGPPWGTGTPPWGAGPPPWASGRPGGGKCPGEDGDDVSIPPEYRSYLPPWCEARWASDAPATSTRAPASTTINSSNNPGRTPSAQRTTFFTVSITRSSTETSSPNNSPPAGSGIETTSSSHAWIAGAAIGSVAGVAFIFSIIFFLWRRRRRTAVAAAAAAAELEAEKAAIELARPVTLYEMEGSSPIDLYVEKPANEAPARELVS